MTVSEIKRFYENDKRLYLPSENIEFLNWIRAKIAQGYCPYLNAEAIEILITKIVNWYELKLPNRLLALGDVGFDNRFLGIKEIFKVMDVLQLRYRLSNSELNTFDCKYRGYIENKFGEAIFYTAIESVDKKQEIYLDYPIRHEFAVNAETGNISMYQLDDYLESDASILNINEFYEKYKDIDNFDFAEIKEVLFVHETDLDLRNKIIDMINLALIYSKNTNPEYGEKRAKIFSAEISKYYNIEIQVPTIGSLMIQNKRKDNHKNIKSLIRKK